MLLAIFFVNICNKQSILVRILPYGSLISFKTESVHFPLVGQKGEASENLHDRYVHVKFYRQLLLQEFTNAE